MIIQIVTGVEVTTGNCFPDIEEILPNAEGGGHYFPQWGGPQWGETISNSDR